MERKQFVKSQEIAYNLSNVANFIAPVIKPIRKLEDLTEIDMLTDNSSPMTANFSLQK